MALRPKFGKGILNALFHTPAIVGIDPEEEKAALIAASVNWGVTAAQYFAAYKNNDYETGGDVEEKYNEDRQKIEASECWETESTDAVEFSYEVTEKVGITNTTTTKKVTFSGWKVKPRSSQAMYYPKKAFLALFTKMPDEIGAGYEEPMYDAEGNRTTYIRVDLHEAIISGNGCISKAAADPDGGAYIVNTELFAFPEVYGPLWGTIVGFGVMESETPGGGDTPTHWGRVTAALTTKEGRIPLFRLGGFKSTLR